MDYPTYDPSSPLTPLSADELDGLDRLLQSLPAEACMSLDGMDGYLTALQIGARPLLAQWPTADWLPLVWGGDGPLGAQEAAPFASKRQRKATVVLLLRHLRHLAEQLVARPDDWEPIFSLAEQGAIEWADARDWCAGFLQAVDLKPEIWGAAFELPLASPILQLGGGLPDVQTPDAPPDDDLAGIDRLSRAVPEAVLQLHRHLRPAP